MTTVTDEDYRKQLDRYHAVAQSEPVTITALGREDAVLISDAEDGDLVVTVSRREPGRFHYGVIPPPFLVRVFERLLALRKTRRLRSVARP